MLYMELIMAHKTTLINPKKSGYFSGILRVKIGDYFLLELIAKFFRKDSHIAHQAIPQPNPKPSVTTRQNLERTN